MSSEIKIILLTTKDLRDKLKEISSEEPLSFFNENEIVGIKKFINLLEETSEIKKND